MADKPTNGTEDLVQAYNKAVESTVGAVDTSVAQATAAAKLLTDAAEAERKEFGKVLEQGAGQARKRSENLAAVWPGMFQGIAATPGPGATPLGPQVQESISKLVESEMAFYESWTGLDAVHDRFGTAAECNRQGDYGEQRQGGRVQPAGRQGRRGIWWRPV